MRRRRAVRRDPRLREGDLVIDAHARARLLGLRVLELDVHVVVGEADQAHLARAAPSPSADRRGAAPLGSDAVARGGAVRANGTRLRDSDRPVPGARDLPLARARRLLAEGSAVLADTRRLG